MLLRKISPFIFCFILAACEKSEVTFEPRTAEINGYSYEYVTNDPLHTRIYTLANGLTVYLSDYKIAPRIQTSIAVRAGGKDDPADNTGLAN